MECQIAEGTFSFKDAMNFIESDERIVFTGIDGDEKWIGMIEKQDNKYVANVTIHSSYSEEGEYRSIGPCGDACDEDTIFKDFNSLDKAKQWIEKKYQHLTDWGYTFVE